MTNKHIAVRKTVGWFVFTIHVENTFEGRERDDDDVSFEVERFASPSEAEELEADPVDRVFVTKDVFDSMLALVEGAE